MARDERCHEADSRYAKKDTDLNTIFAQQISYRRQRPTANTREQIAAVGLNMIEVCRLQNKQLFDVCHAFGISPPHQTSSLQDHTNAGLRDYIVPFLVFVEKELSKTAEAFSVASVAEGRFAALLTAETSKLFPKTSAGLQQISLEFLRPDSEVVWANVGNSCRLTLIKFAKELCGACGIDRPGEIKEGDVKGILKHVLSKTNSGRFKDSLEGLSEGVWNHTQSLLHRSATNKQEATRLFLWTGMLVSEFAQLAKAYNEG